MIGLAAVLFVFSCADWLYNDGSPLVGMPVFRLSVGALAFAAAGTVFFVYDSVPAGLVTALTTFCGALAWTELQARSTKQHSRMALAALAGTIVIAAFVTPALTTAPALGQSPLQRHLAIYLSKLPWGQPAAQPPETVLLVIAAMLFLGSTSNRIVKIVMTLIRTTTSSQSCEEQLKGGRYIGPLERWLIFALALAGQPTAAALVISAKSIVRFPELQSKAAPRGGGQKIDELTEYFLIGSLLSWSLALLAALPIATLPIAV